MSQFDATSTTLDVIGGVQLEGKFAVVTGASSGLGVETCRVLSGAGASVLMIARDSAKLEAAAQDLRQSLPQAQLHSLIMDLADLDSVRAAAADILHAHPQIHLLINNAGVMACPLKRTTQGFEMQFGTNHLGHFLFTCLLAPALLAAAPARVVTLSSAGHKFGNVNLDDPAYHEREYDKWQAYGESKTANALFAVGLDARLGQRGVRSFAVHPGMILTELGRHLDTADHEALMSRRASSEELVFKSVEQGAATSVWAATSVELEGRGGLYLEDCQIAAPAAPEGSNGVESYAVDATSAGQLWRLSEELVGQTFKFD
jgi:NAD(P)-dependent dehydrogenase (short-subunit alcohol dehydrogenase family)